MKVQKQVLVPNNGTFASHKIHADFVQGGSVPCPFCGKLAVLWVPRKLGLAWSEGCEHSAGAVSAGDISVAVHFVGEAA